MGRGYNRQKPRYEWYIAKRGPHVYKKKEEKELLTEPLYRRAKRNRGREKEIDK